MGFAIGVLALPFLALGWYLAALVAILLNRLLDGLTVRWRGAEGWPDAGGFLDISLWIFFFTRWCLLGLSSPHRSKTPWQAAGCCLRLSARAAVFAFAALAAKHQIDNPGYAHKSFYYLGGLTEGK